MEGGYNTGKEHIGLVSCTQQHLSILGLVKAPSIHEALVKSRAKLWEMKSGWEKELEELRSRAKRSEGSKWWVEKQEGVVLKRRQGANKPASTCVPRDEKDPYHDNY